MALAPLLSLLVESHAQRVFVRSLPLAFGLALVCVAPLRADGLVAGCGQWSMLLPEQFPVSGANPALAYDSSRDRIVAYGLLDGAAGLQVDNRVYALNLGGTPTWMDLTPATTGPPATFSPQATYDASRDRMIVVDCPRGPADVWALSFSSGVWQHIVPAGTPPSARSFFTLIYDSSRDRLVLFGGSDQSTGDELNDTYALTLSGTPTWSLLTPGGTAPLSRHAASAIYDTPRDRMVIFGGYTQTQETNDVLALSFTGNGTWSTLSPTGTPPLPRALHSATFDGPRNRMIVVGGTTYDPNGDGTRFTANDVWSMSLANPLKWTRLAPSGVALPPTAGHGTVYDSVRQRVTLFGGGAYGRPFALPMTGTLAWSELIPSSQFPLRRNGALFVYDRPRGRAIMVGGTSPAGPLDDAWALSLTGTPAWTQLLPTGNAPLRQYACGAIDSLNNRLIVFGGNDGLHDQNDTWALSLTGPPVWSRLNPAGSPPPARRHAVAVYDRTRQRLVMCGGADSTEAENTDVWALSLGGSPAWTRLSPSGATPLVGAGAGAVYDARRDRMLVVNGYAADEAQPYQLWALSFAGSGSWSALSSNSAAPEYGQGTWLTLDGANDRLLASGGADWSVSTFALNGGTAWNRVGADQVAPFAQRHFVSAVFDAVAGRVVTTGGSDPSNGVQTIAVGALGFPAGLHSLNFSGDPVPVGTVTADSSWTCFSTGTVVTLTATPAQGFQFTGWTGTVTDTTNPLSLTMNADQNVTAHFAQPPPAADSWRRLLLETGVLGPGDGSSVEDPAIAYDPTQQRLLAAGYSTVPGTLGFDVWQMPLGSASADWSMLTTVALPGGNRTNPLAAYDSRRNRLLIYGGYDSDLNQVLDDVWALRLDGSNTWTQVAAPGGTGPHLYATLHYDSTRDRLLLFGGANNAYGDLANNDTWVLPLSGTPAWGRIAVSGTLPPARMRHTMVYDAARDRYLLYGGAPDQGKGAFNDVWSLGLQDSLPGYWSRVTTDGQAPACGGAAGAIYDPVRDRMIVFGGTPSYWDLEGQQQGSNASDSVFALSFKYPAEPAWIRLAPDGTQPGARVGHLAVYDPVNDRMVFASGYAVFHSNGYAYKSNLADAYALYFGGKYWLDAAPNVPALGAITRSPAADAYASGATVQLTAVPASGVSFLKWSGDATGNANPLTVTMDGNKSILAVFRRTTDVSEGAISTITALSSPAPNPGYLPMGLSFSLVRSGSARLAVFDVAGREVAELARGEMAAGRHTTTWNGGSTHGPLRAGLYFIRLDGPDRSVVRRFVLLR